MDPVVIPQVAVLCAVGVGAGLWLLVRGMGGYRTATRIGDTSTSRIATLAAGEVRVAGTIEPAEVVLISPLQSARCVYYRTTIDESDDTADWRGGTTEERAVGFRIRDGSGAVRVFPNGARFDAPTVFDDRTDSLGAEPPGLQVRTGGAFAAAEPDREALIADLLRVDAGRPDGHPLLRGARGDRRRRRYREARLEVGEMVTVVATALPFGDLRDPAEADLDLHAGLEADDPEVAMNIAEAREAGLLVDPQAAWGNAAIPGFGIGRPVSAPALDPEAARLPLASRGEAERTERTFDIAPETLVLAGTPDTPMLVAYGLARAAVARHQDRFLIGLLGAVLAIGSAVAFALTLAGGFGP